MEGLLGCSYFLRRDYFAERKQLLCMQIVCKTQLATYCSVSALRVELTNKCSLRICSGISSCMKQFFFWQKKPSCCISHPSAAATLAIIAAALTDGEGCKQMLQAGNQERICLLVAVSQFGWRR